MFRFVLLGAALVCGTIACNQPFVVDGKVIAVLDGDTLDMLDADLHQVRVRLASIDAPEKQQAFGQQSKRSLSSLVYGRQVRAVCRKTETRPESGRIRAICTVFAGNVNVNYAQLVAGEAWYYRHYAREQSPAEAMQYDQAERDARSAHRGLWFDASPTPPWDWRHARAEQP